jgi:signal transduction histidine kinase/CheY-like chemotaxis protein
LESARLVVMSGSQPGRRYVLEGTTVIGRALDCDIVLDDPEASRRHLRIQPLAEGAGFRLEDMKSRNGTFVNDELVAEATLRFGDKIRVGDQTLVFARHDPTEDYLLHRQRLEMLGRLSAGVAHDFNNMLGAISATASHLHGTPFEEWEAVEARSCMLEILNATSRAGELANRLLAFARPDSHTRTPLDLSELCHELVQLARRTFPRTMTVESDIRDKLVVEGERAQLHQSLMNLMINARDAIAEKEESGRIVLRARRDDTSAVQPEEPRRVVVEVIDDGCGMDAETTARVFEPFFTTKPRGTGFGIGLSTVAEVIAAHGGRVSAESELGAGSLFRVVLPGSVPARRAKPRRKTMSSGSMQISGRGRLVLVIDDEAVIRRSIRRVLARAGFRVEEAENGEQGLEMIETMTDPPDVLMLDLDLPGMSGEELLPVLRQRDPSLPVLTISGHAISARGIVASDAHLGKPFQAAELLESIFALLGDLERNASSEEVTLT